MVRRTRTDQILADAATAQASSGFEGFVTYFDDELGFEVFRATVVAIDGNVMTLDGGLVGVAGKRIDVANVSYLDYPASED